MDRSSIPDPELRTMNSYLQSPARSLPASLSFYQKLQFQIVNREAPCLVSESGVAVLLNPDNFARPGLVFHRASWDKEVEHLEKTRRVHTQPDGHLVADPSGVWIYLKTTTTPISSLPESGSLLGKYAGLCLETADIQRSLELYQTLGFEPDKGDAEHGWVACKNGLLRLKMVQLHLSKRFTYRPMT